MQAGDYHSIVGGPGAAYWISKQPGVAPWNDRASGSDLVLLAVNESLSLDFFSFHVIAPCIDSPGCDVQDVCAQLCFVSGWKKQLHALLSVWCKAADSPDLQTLCTVSLYGSLHATGGVGRQGHSCCIVSKSETPGILICSCWSRPSSKVWSPSPYLHQPMSHSCML